MGAFRFEAVILESGIVKIVTARGRKSWNFTGNQLILGTSLVIICADIHELYPLRISHLRKLLFC